MTRRPARRLVIIQRQLLPRNCILSRGYIVDEQAHLRPTRALAIICIAVVQTRHGARTSTRVRASNETHAAIANPPNSAQLGGTPLPFLKDTSGSVQSCGNAARDRQTHKHTDTRDRYTFRVVVLYDSREM